MIMMVMVMMLITIVIDNKYPFVYYQIVLCVATLQLHARRYCGVLLLLCCYQQTNEIFYSYNFWLKFGLEFKYDVCIHIAYKCFRAISNKGNTVANDVCLVELFYDQTGQISGVIFKKD